jgi:hypothetical protein
LDNEPSEPAPILRLEELVKWAKGRGLKMIFDVKDTDTEVFKSKRSCYSITCIAFFTVGEAVRAALSDL